MITPTAILEAVSSFYGLEIRDLRGPRRWPRICRARAVGMYLIRETGMSFPKIGILFWKDHTSVMTAVRKAGAWLEPVGADYDPDVAADVEKIRALLAAHDTAVAA